MKHLFYKLLRQKTILPLAFFAMLFGQHGLKAQTVLYSNSFETLTGGCGCPTCENDAGVIATYLTNWLPINECATGSGYLGCIDGSLVGSGTVYARTGSNYMTTYAGSDIFAACSGFNFTAGVTYTLEIWAAAECNGAIGQFILSTNNVFDFYDSNPPFGPYLYQITSSDIGSINSASTSDWTRYTFSFTPTTSGVQSIYVKNTLSGQYFIFYDDFTITDPTPRADLSLSVSPITQTANKGETVTYVYTLTNAGSTTDNVTSKIRVPAGLTLLQAIPQQGSYNNNTKMWDVGTMAVGSKTLTLKLKVN